MAVMAAMMMTVTAMIAVVIMRAGGSIEMLLITMEESIRPGG
jgi:hypothetical protein